MLLSLTLDSGLRTALPVTCHHPLLCYPFDVFRSSSALVPLRPTLTSEARTSLRWKLLVITSLVASVAGAGLCEAFAYLLSASTVSERTFNLLNLATLVPPIASITYATIFVYRHTARRRKLQAVLTALFSLLLTTAIFAYAIIIHFD